MSEVSGFSKLSKDEKISWIVKSKNIDDNLFKNFWLEDSCVQKKLDDLSENTISNFLMPYGLAPNFKINEKIYSVPMVIEESSVVAAASKAAKFWLSRGGFVSRVLGTVKLGHVHFSSKLSFDELKNTFETKKDELLDSVDKYCTNMKNRGGGILSLDLIDKSNELADYYQIEVKFKTCNAMGANFINTILEKLGENFKSYCVDIEINMSILSNYTPECLVEAKLVCKISELGAICKDIDAYDFAKKFKRAIDISKIDISRAVTHNKGIMNGIDSVILATGNDFRAVEAACHAYASKDGHYSGLSNCKLEDDKFEFSLTLPMSIGTVGGLTSLHPLAKASLDILDAPSAEELMQIIACVGLAQNFGAVSSLVTTGIQKGHMKMHLLNILNQLEATPTQIEAAKDHFQTKVISYNEVRNFLNIH